MLMKIIKSISVTSLENFKDISSQRVLNVLLPYTLFLAQTKT